MTTTRPANGSEQPTMRAGPNRALRYAAVAYAIGLVVHTADHVRRGVDAISQQVFWLGIAGSVVAVVAIAAIIAGHRWAPELAVFAGFSQAVGVVLVHFGPPMGAFSDPLVGSGVGAGSVAAAVLEVAGAAAAGLVGARLLRRSRVPAAPASR